MDTSQENWEEFNKINLDLAGNIWERGVGQRGGGGTKGVEKGELGKGEEIKWKRGERVELRICDFCIPQNIFQKVYCSFLTNWYTYYMYKILSTYL